MRVVQGLAHAVPPEMGAVNLPVGWFGVCHAVAGWVRAAVAPPTPVPMSRGAEQGEGLGNDQGPPVQPALGHGL